MVMNVADALAAYTKTSGKSGAIGEIGSISEISGAGSFSDTLKGFVGNVAGTLAEGEKAAAAGATGKADLAGVVTAISNAELMLQTVVTIRDKVIAAYQDITKTAI